MTKKHFVSDNYNDLYVDVLKEISNNPEYVTAPRGIKCKEITNLTFELLNPRARMVWNLARKNNYNFAMKFFIWMLNGSSDFSYVSSVNPNAIKFIDKDEKGDVPATFSTAYGPRIVEQLPFVIKELQNDKDSRRAVIKILYHSDLQEFAGKETKAEYPCTNAFTFLIRDNKLNMYTSMRSNNMVKTICYDLFNMTMFQEYVYQVLKITYPELELGKYSHQVVSAHFFDEEQGMVDAIIEAHGKEEELGIPM